MADATGSSAIQVGSLAVAKRTTAVCEAGEIGVCYEVYRLENRPGYSFIFERGRYDGFSPDDVRMILDVTGHVCPSLTGYRFRNVIELARDHHAGRFAAAFPQHRGAA